MVLDRGSGRQRPDPGGHAFRHAIPHGPARGRGSSRRLRRRRRRSGATAGCGAGATRVRARRGSRNSWDRLGAFLILVGLSGLAVGGVGVSGRRCAPYLGGKNRGDRHAEDAGRAPRGDLPDLFPPDRRARGPRHRARTLARGSRPPAARAGHRGPAADPGGLRALSRASAGGGTLRRGWRPRPFTLWPLARAEEVRAATLFRDALSGGSALPRARYVVATGLSGRDSPRGGVLLFGHGGADALDGGRHRGRAGAAGVGGGPRKGPRPAGRAGPRGAGPRCGWRWGQSARGAAEATSVVLSLGLGLSVLAGIGQIDGNIRQSITTDLPAVAPSYFFVDIQPGQIDGFRERVETEPAVSPRRQRADAARHHHPHQTARRPWRPQAGTGGAGRTAGVTLFRQPARRGGTDRRRLGGPKAMDGPPLVSFAAEEAAEIGLDLGDEKSPSTSSAATSSPTIASFRQVDFETAGIGFILSMKPRGRWPARPHSWISTVYASARPRPPSSVTSREAYPNIQAPAIRVGDAIERGDGAARGHLGGHALWRCRHAPDGVSGADRRGGGRAERVPRL